MEFIEKVQKILFNDDKSEIKKLEAENSELKRKIRDTKKEIDTLLKSVKTLPNLMDSENIYKHYPKDYSFNDVSDAFTSGVNTMLLIQKQKIEDLKNKI